MNSKITYAGEVQSTLRELINTVSLRTMIFHLTKHPSAVCRPRYGADDHSPHFRRGRHRESTLSFIVGFRLTDKYHTGLDAQLARPSRRDYKQGV